ncbi:amidohydrolase family protein [Pirellulaceae bacterium SH467]
MKTNRLFIRLGLLGLMGWSLADSDAYAWQPPGGRGPNRGPQRDNAKQRAAPTEGEKKQADAPKQETEWLAIVGGDVHTVSREVIRRGTVLVENGKIKAIGTNLDIPEKATRIDATGKWVTPGFIALNMSGVGVSGGTDGKLADEFNPFDRNMQFSLSVGITSGAVQVRAGGQGRGRRSVESEAALARQNDEFYEVTERFPGFDPDASELDRTSQALERRTFGELVQLCPCCSLPILPTEPIAPTPPSPIVPQKSSVIKMSFGQLDGMLVKEVAFLDLTPGALNGATNQAAWRDQIQKAKQYLKDQAAHEQSTREGKRENPPRKPVSDEILSLVKKEIALRIPASRVSEMRELCQLSNELDYRLVIKGGIEGWVIPKDLAEANVGLTITPRVRREPRFGEETSSGSWIELPRVLESSGIPFAVEPLEGAVSMVGLAGRDLMSLPLEAAFAVRGGASEAKALASITMVPAAMLGLEDRLGAIEVGRDADLLILNGNPLDYRTYVETAIVNGRTRYQRNQDFVLPVYERK